MSEESPAGSGIGASEIAQGDTEVTSSELDVLSDGEPEEEVGLRDDNIIDDEEEEGTEEAGEAPTEDEDKELAASGEDDDDVDEDLEDVDDDDDEEEALEASEDEDAKITLSLWYELKKKHPEIAKDKRVKELFFTHQAYREVFPTVKDAKVASESSEAFDVLSNHLYEGRTEEVMKVMAPEILENFADTFLISLYKHNPKYYARATRPLIIDIMHNVHDHAVSTKDKNLQASVRNLSRYLTGNPEIPARKTSATTDPEVQKERDALRQERLTLRDRSSNEFITSADALIGKRLEKLVEEGLDVNEELPDFTYDAIVDKTIEDIKQTLLQDSDLLNRIANLRKQAERSGFTKDSQSRIISTYLERARRIARKTRARHLDAALERQSSEGENGRGGTKKVVTKNKKVTTSGGRRVTTSRKIDTTKTSPEDFIHERNVHYK